MKKSAPGLKTATTHLASVFQREADTNFSTGIGTFEEYLSIRVYESNENGQLGCFIDGFVMEFYAPFFSECDRILAMLKKPKNSRLHLHWDTGEACFPLFDLN